MKEKEIKISRSEYTSLKFFSVKNYLQLKTPFAFVDETGVLNNEKDPYFAIGLVKSQRAQTLYPKFRSLRSRYHLNAELKFNILKSSLLPIAKDFLDVVLLSPVSKFSCVIIPKKDQNFDPEKYFKNDIFEIYRKFLIKRPQLPGR